MEVYVGNDFGALLTWSLVSRLQTGLDTGFGKDETIHVYLLAVVECSSSHSIEGRDFAKIKTISRIK